MDGGIDFILSRYILKGCEKKLRDVVADHGYTSLLGRKYLPIGSSCIIDRNDNKVLVSCPTMLLPQDVSKTKNCYYSTMACLYSIAEYYPYKNYKIIMTSACCGYGKMNHIESLHQCFQAIRNYKKYGNDDIVMA